tara:strand:+ start:1488 stop:2165 length:678 start_codon:yes stop_codon:yes gene_type:complete
MLKSKTKHFVSTYKNFFSKEECTEWIDFFKKQNKLVQSRQDHEGALTIHKKDNSYTLGLKPSDKKRNEDFGEKLMNFFQDYMEINPGLLGSSFGISGIKIQETKPSGGYHVWHAEQCSMEPERAVVFTVYLNDIKKGGETEFLDQSYRLSPKQGTLCLFPASYTHLHRGNPPLKKTKYIITGWIVYNWDHSTQLNRQEFKIEQFKQYLKDNPRSKEKKTNKLSKH